MRKTQFTKQAKQGHSNTSCFRIRVIRVYLRLKSPLRQRQAKEGLAKLAYSRGDEVTKLTFARDSKTYRTSRNIFARTSTEVVEKSVEKFHVNKLSS